LKGRWKFWVIVGLSVAVLAAAITFPALRRHVKQAASVQEKSEEQARRELTPPTVVNPGAPQVKTKLFWASGSGDGTLAPVIVELPLANEPVLRAKQVLNTLLAGPVDSELRTLPPDAALLAFYILPDGTGIADFSEALATSIPSGIASEQLAVDSITRTLEANVPQVQRLKILIHGQEVDTLAGHVDLTVAFVVNTRGGQAMATPAAAPVTVPATTPGSAAPASGPSPAKPGPSQTPPQAGSVSPRR
jgi:Sporulation and spore germination